ncbi:unnamed protein product [Ixodes hexagonus]
MAFMMPVVRNDYDIYNRSRKCSPETSHGGSPSGSTSLSTSPCVHDGEDVRKMFRTSEHLDVLQPARHRSGSLGSLKKFHHVLVDKLKRAGHQSGNHNHGVDSATAPAKKENADNEPR